MLICTEQCCFFSAILPRAPLKPESVPEQDQPEEQEDGVDDERCGNAFECPGDCVGLFAAALEIFEDVDALDDDQERGPDQGDDPSADVGIAVERVVPRVVAGRLQRRLSHSMLPLLYLAHNSYFFLSRCSMPVTSLFQCSTMLRTLC